MYDPTTLMKFSKSVTIAAFAAILAQSAQSAAIANWKELNPDAGSTNSGMNTDSPTIGDATANDADNAWVAGQFGTVASPVTVSLDVGQTLTVSGSVNLTGGVGDAAQFRFGVFDDNGAFASNSSTFDGGGWLAVPLQGMFQARTNGGFVSTLSNAANILAAPSSTGTWDPDSSAAYNWSFSVTRDSATTVDLVATLDGGDGNYGLTFTKNDQTTSVFTYTAVGILFGGTMDLDQGQLSNVQYNLTGVPEPSTTFAATIAPAVVPDTYDIQWPSQTGATYTVLTSPDLATPVVSWTVVEADVDASPPQNTYNVPADGARRFYRISETPAP